MTSNEEDQSIAAMEFCRKHFRTLGEVEFAKRGAQPVDIAIGAIFAAVDLAQHHTGGDTSSALLWARAALDMMEFQARESLN